MKKSIKLIISCLLLSVCCFCVVGCCSNKSIDNNNSDKTVNNNSDDEYTQRINKEVNNFLKNEGFENAIYKHKNKTITIDCEDKKEEVKYAVENYIKVKDIEVIVNE